MTDIFIYDEISEWGISAQSVKDQLPDDKSEEISIHLNSPGGSVFEGVTIYNLLKQYENVTVIIEGLAASIASVIAMAGNIKMLTGSLMMIHNPLMVAAGESEDLRKGADSLDKVKETLLNIYIQRTGLPENKISELMNNETWLTGAEALELGFIDSIEEAPAIAAKFDLEKYGFTNINHYHKGDDMARSKNRKVQPKNEVVEPEAVENTTGISESIEEATPEEAGAVAEEVETPAEEVAEVETPAEEVAEVETPAEEVAEPENIIKMTPEELAAHNKTIIAAENKRQQDIKELAFPGQDKLIENLVNEGSTLENAVFKINADYKQKVLNGEVKQVASKDLNDFENAGIDHVIVDDSNGDKNELSLIDQMSAIKDNVERQKFYRANKADIMALRGWK